MHIKLAKFEGPLQLLLQMIEERKLAISEISLLQVTDQYLNYVKTAADLDPAQLADFLVVAAKLLLIKAKSLLPYLTTEEEGEIEEFTAKLKMYQEFLQAAKTIEQRLRLKRFMFAREFDLKTLRQNLKSFWPPKRLTANQLNAVMREIISHLTVPEKLAEQIMAEEIKIEERIELIKNLLKNKLKILFSHLTQQAASRTEIVVSFLAILELVKQQDIVISQNELFGEIEIVQI